MQSLTQFFGDLQSSTHYFLHYLNILVFLVDFYKLQLFSEISNKYVNQEIDSPFNFSLPMPSLDKKILKHHPMMPVFKQ